MPSCGLVTVTRRSLHCQISCWGRKSGRFSQALPPVRVGPFSRFIVLSQRLEGELGPVPLHDEVARATLPLCRVGTDRGAHLVLSGNPDDQRPDALGAEGPSRSDGGTS